MTKETKRLAEVLTVVFKHGMGYIIEDLELKYHLPFLHKIQKHKFHAVTNPQERLVPILEELGGTYIKLGQLLSIRPDLIHLDYCTECARLQDNVKPFAFSEVKEIIEQEFKKPILEIYKSFNEKPIAAASIGQVHEARLRDGTRVAVKVQRPHIKELFEADINIMSYIAKKMEGNSKFKKYRPSLIIEEFKRYTQNELDYIQEARNAEEFYENFKGSKRIKIPRIFWESTTQRVITMEYIDGIKIKDLLTKKKSDIKKIIDYGLEAEFKQIFEDGFFHADLHPGNILLLKNRQIAFLDFGIAGHLSQSLRRYSVELFLAMMDRNSKTVSELLQRIGTLQDSSCRQVFEQQVEEVLHRWYGTNISQIRITKMLHQLFNICAENDLRLPTDLVLLGKALVTIEATGQLVEAKFDLFSAAKPYLTKAYENQGNMELVELQGYYKKIRRGLLSFPERVDDLFDAIKNPKLKIDLEDSDVKRLGLELDRSSNRLSYGILISSFVIAGAILVNVGPKFGTVSYMSVLFFTFAFIIGMFLLYSVVTEGK